ncbi:unnamed protein product [Prorocentrum cordatum]|uniref:Uncharacterized protein n=1 Tax=Prorocentrum cordatum TaxID=2364126 RepID=A0ABN9VAJ8_9DINO|nr:unnamed protein product [Polarella glacialis]
MALPASESRFPIGESWMHGVPPTWIWDLENVHSLQHPREECITRCDGTGTDESLPGAARTTWRSRRPGRPRASSAGTPAGARDKWLKYMSLQNFLLHTAVSESWIHLCWARLTAAVAAEGSTSASPRALVSWLSLARGVLAQGRRGRWGIWG